MTRSISYQYGPDGQRVMSRMYKNGSLYCRKFYWGEYEEIYYYSNSETVRTYWVEAPDGLAGMFWTSTSDYYTVVHPNVAMTDHLGSLTGLYDYDGNKVFDASYDAWGKRTLSPNSFTFIARGYTGHEHLDELGMINMNGRMYDPRQGRFLSPDPFVQAPSNPQNYNRYSYCLNNPLKYTDPSGEIFWEAVLISSVITANINVGMQGLMGNINNCDDVFKFYSIGLLAGAAGACVGDVVSGAIKYGGFINGLASGASNGFTSAFINEAGNAWINGSSFEEGMGVGLNAGFKGMLTGALIGGISRGIIDKKQGYNFWNGSRTFELKDGVVIKDPEFVEKYDSRLNDMILKDRYAESYGLYEGHLGIKRITTEPGQNYFLMKNGKYYSNGYSVLGHCRTFSTGYQELHICPYVTNSNEVLFKATAGHELIHAAHNYAIPSDLFVKADSEKVAYKYTFDILLNGGYSELAIKKMMIAITNNYYGYAPIYYYSSLYYLGF